MGNSQSGDFSEDDFKNLGQGHKILTNILREFDNICRTNELEYWCVGGTLIGTVRHKGWIPHDGDIDIAMLESDYKKLQNIVQKNLSKDYWFQDKTTDKYYRSDIGKIRYLYAHYGDYKPRDWHNGIQLDIFVFKDEQEFLDPISTDYEIKKISRDMIFPLKELTFEDIKVYVPNKYEQYVTDAWGACPPPILPKDQQFPHEGRISFTIPDWMKIKYPQLYPDYIPPKGLSRRRHRFNR